MLIFVSIISYGLDVSARGAIVLNAQTNEVVYEKGAYDRHAMASTTKIMTALIALEYGNLEETITVGKIAASQEGSSMYLYEGEKIKLIDLVYGMMLSSGNDAAMAIAEHIGGDKQKFIELMNRRAIELGLKDTKFLDPCGFYFKEHYTTAYELALLSSFAMKNPTFAKISETKRWHAGTLKNGKERWVFNHNKLLSSYKGANGIKTGYTIDSGRCLVSSAQRDGVQLICVTLNCSNDWNEHKKMLDYGFSIISKNLVLKNGEKSFNIPVGGGDKDFITVINKRDSFINTQQLNTEDVKIIINLPKMIFAPVDEKKQIGNISVMYKGVLTDSIPLYPESSVNSLPLEKSQSLLDLIINFINKLFGK